MTQVLAATAKHQHDTQICFAKLREIGRRYGRTIMADVIAWDLPTELIQAAVDVATEDFTKFLLENGICEEDIEVSVRVVRSAIINEGNSIALMLPEHMGDVQ